MGVVIVIFFFVKEKSMTSECEAKDVTMVIILWVMQQ
jgi:hypothetical protein